MIILTTNIDDSDTDDGDGALMQIVNGAHTMVVMMLMMPKPTRITINVLMKVLTIVTVPMMTNDEDIR